MSAAADRETLSVDGPLDDLRAALDAGSSSQTPEARHELLVAIHTVVDVTTRPRTIVVRLRAQGRSERVHRFQTITTTTEATLLALTHLVRGLDAPTRLVLGLDDPTVARVLDREIEPPPWLSGVARALFDEMDARDVAIEIEHIDLGDCIAPEPTGDG
jgi:hypothetical protein